MAQTPRSGSRGVGRALEALGAALQLPSTPRFRSTVDAVDAIGSVLGSEPSAPHRPTLPEGPVADTGPSYAEAAAVRRVQASAESAVVARALEAIRVGTAELDLWGSGLSDQHVAVVLDAVRGSRSSIRTVDLGCNTIGEEALHALELLLALGDVRELKLGGNSIGDLALARIVKAMPRTSGGLELMSLEANCLTDAGVAELCSFLETDGCRSLTSLNVANNNLSAAAAHALQVALSAGNSRVRELHMRRNGMGDLGAFSLASLLRHKCCHLEILDFAENQVRLRVCPGSTVCLFICSSLIYPMHMYVFTNLFSLALYLRDRDRCVTHTNTHVHVSENQVSDGGAHQRWQKP
jgi:hypothetical protein